MSAVVIDNGLVHYEVIGRGRPVILLHGWLGSWRYWMGTMEALARKYRCYALDFWGFGDSDKSRTRCSLSDYLILVDAFMERLGLLDAPLVGHSMGGTIAIRLALEYPQRVSRLVLVSTPVAGRSVTPIIKLASNPTLNRLFWRRQVIAGWGRPLLQRWIATGWQVWYREILDDVLKVTATAAQQSGRSLIQTDLRSQLQYLKLPVTALHGGQDSVVAPSELRHFQNGSLPTATAVPFPRSQHFPMLDAPDQFYQTVLEALSR